MARRKDQATRRGEVAEEAERTVARHGAEAVRVTDRAAEVECAAMARLRARSISATPRSDP